MKKWPQEAYRWYRDACDMFNYPGLPYGNLIKELVSDSDRVLDIGCGIGVASIMMSPWCRRVIAMDQDKNTLNCLEAEALALGISNIEIVNDSWPLQMPIQADVIIALHVYNVMRSFDNLKLIFESANKGGFIACNALTCYQDEPFVELKEELGIIPKHKMCANGCYIKGIMEAMGARVTCEKTIYEFGQPLDTFEEVVHFIQWQIMAEDSMIPIIGKYVDRYVNKTDGKYLVPITRHCCAITFTK